MSLALKLTVRLSIDLRPQSHDRNSPHGPRRFYFVVPHSGDSGTVVLKPPTPFTPDFPQLPVRGNMTNCNVDVDVVYTSLSKTGSKQFHPTLPGTASCNEWDELSTAAEYIASSFAACRVCTDKSSISARLRWRVEAAVSLSSIHVVPRLNWARSFLFLLLIGGSALPPPAGNRSSLPPR